MYWLVSQIINKITGFLRLFQIFLIAYLIVDVIYWILVLGKFVYAARISFLYKIPVNAIYFIAQHINWNIGEKYSTLYPAVFCSIILIFLVLIISNIIFVLLGELEKNFTEKAYEKGERDYE